MTRGSALIIPAFILVALSILYSSHYFIYYSIAHFFGIASHGRKVMLALLLFLLPTGFIVFSILAPRMENGVFRVLYFFTGLWLGVGLTLMTFFVLAWAAWGVVRLSTHSPNRAAFGGIAVVLASLYSCYGVWNAYHPRTEHIKVKMGNLPPEWRGKRLVQLSDVHLGIVLGPAFLQRLVERINTEDPSIVFITGDLFDGADSRLDELVVALDNLRAPLGVYFVTGNHETYLGTDRAYAALKKTKVRILDDELVGIDGLQIIGVSYPELGSSKDIAEVTRKLPGFAPGAPSILLYHNPTQVEQAKGAGINLQLSGHTHKGQIFPIQLISRLIYRKYYNGLHVEDGFTIYTSSGAGTWGPTMRTGNHPEIVVIELE
ncbi:MAG: metallophosphoesterase [Acidobacteria bacterium]|nr:metallophosphoesterase [Acidobacteriota bacterium]